MILTVIQYNHRLVYVLLWWWLSPLFCCTQIKTHLQDMYTHPATAEQCLHNALKIVNAMRYVGLDYDIQVHWIYKGMNCLEKNSCSNYIVGNIHVFAQRIF